MFFFGQEGVNRNLEASAKLHKMGALQKDPLSMHAYGLMQLKVCFIANTLKYFTHTLIPTLGYFKGQGVDENPEEAVKYLEEAASMVIMVAIRKKITQLTKCFFF